MNRRQFLQSLSAVAVAPFALSQGLNLPVYVPVVAPREASFSFTLRSGYYHERVDFTSVGNVPKVGSRMRVTMEDKGRRVAEVDGQVTEVVHLPSGAVTVTVSNVPWPPQSFHGEFSVGFLSR